MPSVTPITRPNLYDIDLESIPSGRSGWYRSLLQAARAARESTHQGGALGAFTWSVAVFADLKPATVGRRLEDLLGTIEAWPSTFITVVAHGPRHAGIAEVVREATARRDTPHRVVEIPHQDMSNAWNQYVYGLRPLARHHLFVDSRLTVAPGGLDALRETMEEKAGITAATGVPGGDDRRARYLRQLLHAQGGLGAGLYALREEFLERIVERGIFLPVDLADPKRLIGSLICHDLAPHRHWSATRVMPVDRAGCRSSCPHPWTPWGLRHRYQRHIRQARAKMENQAIHRLIYADGFESLPELSRELIDMTKHALPRGRESRSQIHFRRAALDQEKRTTPPSPADLLPLA